MRRDATYEDGDLPIDLPNGKPLTRGERTPMGKPGKGHHAAAPQKLNWDLFVKICATLRKTGVHYASCRAHGMAYVSVMKRIRAEQEDGYPEWRQLWEASKELFADDLEKEIVRRGFHGYKEQVYHKGEVVGELTKYSDALATLMMKAVRPTKFRENVKIDADVRTGVLVVPERVSVEEWLEKHNEK